MRREMIEVDGMRVMCWTEVVTCCDRSLGFRGVASDGGANASGIVRAKRSDAEADYPIVARHLKAMIDELSMEKGGAK